MSVRLSSLDRHTDRSKPRNEGGADDMSPSLLAELAPGLLAVILSPTAVTSSGDGVPKASVIGYLVDCAPKLLSGKLDPALFLGLAKVLRAANTIETQIFDHASNIGQTTAASTRRLAKILALSVDLERVDLARDFPTTEEMLQSEASLRRIVPSTVQELLGF